MKANSDIRQIAKENGVKHWQIAMHMGVSEQTFMRWMRTPISKDREKAILCAIEELAKEAQ